MMKLGRSAIAVFALLVGFLAVLGQVQAQATGTASLNGTITDTSGGIIAGASLKLVDTRTNNSYTAQTNSTGGYRFVDVAPGPAYALTITKDGFQTVTINGIYLPVAVATTRDIQLTIGQISQTIEVTAETGSVSLNTTDATIGNNLDMHAVENLPNEFRGDPANLLRIQAGVVSAQVNNGQAVQANLDPNHSRDGSVAGARADQNNIVVDGIDAVDFAGGQAFSTQAPIAVDAIQEFNTQIAQPSAAYGGRSGAQTVITTKSGTNDWHGSLYEYNRTAATEANTFFNNQAGVPRLALIRNQFGGNVGGPVLKDKLFFFFEYDGRRDRSAQSELQIVPFPHVALGEIAYIKTGCPDSSVLTSADVPTACVAFASAATVKSLDPCSTAACSAPGFVQAGQAPILQSLFTHRYPKPNDFTGEGDGINTAGLLFNAPAPVVDNGYISRVDYNINGNNKLFARFNLTNNQAVNNANGNLSIQFPGDPLTATDVERDRAWVVGETWTINSNTINQLTLGETRANIALPIAFEPPAPASLYELSFFGAFEGDTFATPYERQTSQAHVVPDPTLRDDVTFIRGKHTFQFGGQWNPVKVRSALTNDFVFIQEGLGGAIQSLTPAFRPADISTSSYSEENWDNVFAGDLGLIWNSQASINYNGSGTAQPFGSSANRDFRIYEMAGYFEDSWRVRSDLTVTAGVRYQYQQPPYEVHGTEAQFYNTNFNALWQARVAAGLAGETGIDATPLITYQLTGKKNPGGRPLYSPEKDDFSPRLALAWNPSFTEGILGRVFGDHKSVVRAGGDLLYDESVIYAITNFEDQSNYLFGNTVATEFNSGQTTTFALENDPRMNSASQAPYPVPAPPFTNPLTPFAIFNDGIDPKLKTPYSITASLGIQRELPGGFQLETDYFGRFGRRLMQLGDAGQAMNFVDATPDHESLVTAFSYLERQSRLPGTPDSIAAGLTAQPFFETNMNSALAADGLGTCATFYAATFTGSGVTPNCTNAVFLNNLGALQQGGTGGILPALPLPVNVGLNPQFFVDAIMANKGFSDYNSLIVTLRKRLSNGLQFDFNYTFSHSIDNGSTVSNENGNYESGATAIMCDVTNNRACRGNSEFDATHQIAAEFVYSLPFGRGQTFGRDAGWILNEAIGGWSVSGIETWRTGVAYTANDIDNSSSFDTVSLAADTGVLFTGSRAPLSSDIHVTSTGAVQMFANPALAAAQFSPVTGLQSPNRDTLRGPHFSNLDLAVSKNFPLGSERYRLQFRAEAYNALNHPNFGLPGTGILNNNWGVITGLAGQEPSRVMQFALRFDF